MDSSFVAKKLIEHDERLERIEEKIDKTLNRNEFLETMDKVIKTLDRLDQERLFQIHRLDRHEEDIAKLKTKVGLTD